MVVLKSRSTIASNPVRYQSPQSVSFFFDAFLGDLVFGPRSCIAAFCPRCRWQWSGDVAQYVQHQSDRAIVVGARAGFMRQQFACKCSANSLLCRFRTGTILVAQILTCIWLCTSASSWSLSALPSTLLVLRRSSRLPVATDLGGSGCDSDGRGSHLCRCGESISLTNDLRALARTGNGNNSGVCSAVSWAAF